MSLNEFTRLRNHCYEADNGFLIWQITPKDSSRTFDLDGDNGSCIGFGRVAGSTIPGKHTYFREK